MTAKEQSSWYTPSTELIYQCKWCESTVCMTVDELGNTEEDYIRCTNGRHPIDIKTTKGFIPYLDCKHSILHYVIVQELRHQGWKAKES